MNDVTENNNPPEKADTPKVPPAPPALPEELVRDSFELLEGSKSPFGILEALLKQPKKLYTEVRDGQRAKVCVGLAIICLVSLCGYGLIAGCFTGGAQIWQAPVKIALGLLFSGLICLPSLYIFTCLGQVDVKFSEVVVFLLAMLAMAAVMLVGLAPVLFVFTMSTESLVFMGVMHLIFWVIAAFFGYRFFMSVFEYMTGVKGDKGYMVLWMFILSFVVLQMSTSLRPIIGPSEQILTSEKKFFMAHWMEEMQDDEAQWKRD